MATATEGMTAAEVVDDAAEKLLEEQAAEATGEAEATAEAVPVVEANGEAKGHAAGPVAPEPSVEDSAPTPADAHLNMLRELAWKCQDAHDEYLSAKEAAKEAKDAWEAKVTELQKAAMGKPETLPLFDQAKGGDAENAPAASVEATPAPDESWRSAPLAEILPANLAAKLAEHSPPLTTMGELSDWQNAGEHNDLSTIKGIGPAKVDKISDAMAEFWAKWNADKAAREKLLAAASEGVAFPADMPMSDAERAAFAEGWITTKAAGEKCWTVDNPHAAAGTDHSYFALGHRTYLESLVPIPTDYVLTDDEQDAFRKGWIANRKGEKRKKAPFAKGSSDAIQWGAGWDAAKEAQEAASVDADENF